VLRLDRYLVTGTSTRDLATGRRVSLLRRQASATVPMLFGSHRGRTLIDLDVQDEVRLEVWERWRCPPVPADAASVVADVHEALAGAVHGAPRVIDLGLRFSAEVDYLHRALARAARQAGWVPVSLEWLARRLERAGLPKWMSDRTLVLFGAPGLPTARAAFARLAHRNLRPHVVVCFGARSSDDHLPAETPMAPGPIEARERGDVFPTVGAAGLPTIDDEARARWAFLTEEVCGGSNRSGTALDLAEILVGRRSSFEAHALVGQALRARPELSARAESVTSAIEATARASVEHRVHGATRSAGRVRGWEMVDDFVGVLQLCQDVEDERTALARVGAFLRDRLQAAAVAVVARESGCPRVLARVGSDTGRHDLAERVIESGVHVPPARGEGPAEAATPVRHAADVIGAVWCRWSAGTLIAADHATSLLGVAAAAMAPSVRLAMVHWSPPTPRDNPVPELVGGSPAIAAVREAIVRAAASPFPVMVEGESGSGKELAARAIHARSARRARRFCALNCAALVDELVEAELFGHARGAFTGAAMERSGVFEDASGGTLFLDEVAELGPRVQAKLLRTLQEGEVRRLGESAVRRVDVRVVAATNRPLAAEVQAGAFRADLWYRLDVIRITLPPLRERLDDLPLLVSHLWTGLAARTQSRAVLSASAIASLASYDWPGNIRELQNVLASAMVTTSRAGVIGPSALPAHIARAASLERKPTLATARRRFEERFVRAALARSGGRLAPAARDLGLSRQGLCKAMSRLGIPDERPESRPDPHVQ
jgi:DNA-binding NtrC family response regulator